MQLKNITIGSELQNIAVKVAGATVANVVANKLPFGNNKLKYAALAIGATWLAVEQQKKHKGKQNVGMMADLGVNFLEGIAIGAGSGLAREFGITGGAFLGQGDTPHIIIQDDAGSEVKGGAFLRGVFGADEIAESELAAEYRNAG